MNGKYPLNIKYLDTACQLFGFLKKVLGKKPQLRVII